jgi:Ca2+-binding EF-hand superfamily protein
MEQTIDRMFGDMDTNHDGKISKSEWMAFWMAVHEKEFRRLDKNGHGFITRDDIRADMIEKMRAQQQQQRARPPQ